MDGWMDGFGNTFRVEKSIVYMLGSDLGDGKCINTNIFETVSSFLLWYSNR